MSAIPVPHLTPEEYLAIERAAEFKSEYYEGEMFAMSGGLLSHALIGAALVTALAVALRGRKCFVVGSDLRVQVARKGPYFYPDVTVCCGEPELGEDHGDNLLNPTVVLEVLSPSTEAFDRGKKFAAYRSIESLREYVLVSQTDMTIETYVKGTEGQWTFTAFAGPDAVCHLKSIGCEIPLADIYRDIPIRDIPI